MKNTKLAAKIEKIKVAIAKDRVKQNNLRAELKIATAEVRAAEKAFKQADRALNNAEDKRSNLEDEIYYVGEDIDMRLHEIKKLKQAHYQSPEQKQIAYLTAQVAKLTKAAAKKTGK